MKCPNCDKPMTLFGSKIYEGAMVCNECYEKLISSKQALSRPAQQEDTYEEIEPRSEVATTTTASRPLLRPRDSAATTSLTHTSSPGEAKTLAEHKLGGLIKKTAQRQQKLEQSAPSEEFVPLSPQHFKEYRQELEKKAQVPEIAESVKKFITPQKSVKPLRPPRPEIAKEVVPQKMSILPSQPITPPSAPIKENLKETLENSFQSLEERLEELFSIQENMKKELMELRMQTNYAVQLLEAIYQAMGGELG